MRKVRCKRNAIAKLGVLVGMLLTNTFMFAQFRGDGPKEAVFGSPHDLRKFAKGNDQKTSACDYCHTKMDTGNGESSLPWNENVKAAGFKPYASATFNGSDITAASSGVEGISSNATLMCLGCHDGAVAHRDMGTNIRDAGPQKPLDLSADHPVHFVYSYQLTRSNLGLQAPVEGLHVAVPYVGRITSLPLYKDSPDDGSGRMECATCHNPHDGTARYFLRMNNDRSNLCLNCH